MLDALGLRTFPIPLELPSLTIGMAWHPRNHHDRTHQFLRARTRHLMTAAAVPPEGTRSPSDQAPR
jgi:hypothetical protein